MVDHEGAVLQRELLESRARWMRLRDRLNARLEVAHRASQLGLEIDSPDGVDRLQAEVDAARQDYDARLSEFQD